MDLVSHSVLFISAACLTLGVVNLRLWLSDRARLDLLAITISLLCGAVYSSFEVALMHTVSPGDWGEILRWSLIPSWATVVSLAIFLRLHLKTGRLWLLWAIIGLRTLGTCINFAMPVNIQYREITAIRQISVLGEKLSYPVGVPNPWHLILVLTFVLLFIFGVDALVTVWRLGERRKALVIAGGVTLLAASSLAIAGSIVWSSAAIPVIVSPALMFIVGGMAIELDYDLRRSQRLTGELAKRQAELTETLEQLNLSAGAAQVGIWTRYLETDRFWVSQKLRELFEFDDSRPITVSRYLEKVHPDDRERLQQALKLTEETGQPYDTEYRVQLADGDIRWLRSMGQIQTLESGEKLLRGASVDITRRKLAEDDAHELSRKLMGAQEKERARLARELHDDLSQSLALLSIQLQSLCGENVKPGMVKKQVGQLTEQIQRLSSDVHRISHELHPSKLTQLGLEAALRGFCRETGAANGLKVRFEAKGVPGDLPNDISLCLYRIAQESLQNIVKHSATSFANVSLEAVNGDIRLAVSDNGCGFDPEAVKSKESLGLISMHERIRAVKGTLTVESVLDAGTRVEAQVPLPTT
jgi:PAS domain S-box-containing protein